MALACAAVGATAAGPASAAAAAKVSVAKTDSKVAVTKLGAVEYRSVGTGRALVMVMGFGSSMEDWDPAFVDGLARTHRVVIFNNAGIGKSKAIASKLTLSAMGDRTGALITALRLGKPDVLGWSMGGMITQAFVARHPQQVRRLVLAATKPGDGNGTSISAEESASLGSLGPDEFNAALFPDDLAAVAKAYGDRIALYEHRSNAPDALFGRQRAAINGWTAGDEPAGRALRKVKAKTLIAAGRGDRFIPFGNSRLIAKLLRNSQVKLYSHAGHGFLFQPDTKFVSRVNTFLKAR